jgi:hypothetical protein
LGVPLLRTEILIQRFERRLRAIVELKIREQGQSESALATVLDFLERLLITMGEEGVSSDDSNVDANGPFLRPRKMPWRRKVIEMYMEWIDQAAAGSTEVMGKGSGAFPMRRIREGTQKISQRLHVDRLPKCLYEAEWLRENGKKKTVNVGEDDFEWMEIVFSA